MTRHAQRGAALFTALFLIVVIAIVAALVAQLAATQQISSGRSLEATRAYYAARTRLDREIDRALAAAGCPAAATETIAGFTTDRDSCTDATVVEGGSTYQIITLGVAAYRGDRTAGTLVRRELRAMVTNH